MQTTSKREPNDTLLAVADKPLASSSISIDELHLEVVAGPHKGLRIPVHRESILIGRGHWCDLCLEDDFHISKQHAELSIREDGVLIHDLGSRNGITINNVRVHKAFLEVNATLAIGQSKMLLRARPRKQRLELRYYDRSQQLVGQSQVMRTLFAQLERLGPMEFPVLLTGETGVGKTCIARAIHQQSLRRDKPFVVVNCGAISPTLIESLFFGYEKGAFTGADKSHRGYFEQANGGTLFLDEIGELPLELQPRLLDVLERGKVQRLGSEATRDVDLRILSATHRTLSKEVKAGTFREDLFYRLAVVELEVPPLRDRVEDIPLLLDWLSKEWKLDQDVSFTSQAIHRLQQYPWPGNVRQLRNVLKRSIAFAGLNEENEGSLTIDQDGIYLPTIEKTDDIEEPPAASTPRAPTVPEQPTFGSLKALMEHTEKQALLNALEQHSWNVAAAANSLEITRAWLYKRIKKYNFTPPTSTTS